MDTVDIPITEFNSICRICLDFGRTLLDVFDKNAFAYNNTMAETIMECAPVKVLQDDGLPTFICSECITKLHTAHEFRTLCIRSDSVLRRCLENSTKSCEPDVMDGEIVNGEIVVFIKKEEADEYNSEEKHYVLTHDEPTVEGPTSSNNNDQAEFFLEEVQEYEALEVLEEDEKPSLPIQTEKVPKRIKIGPLTDRKNMVLYKCKICEKKFTRKSNFDNHKRDHNGDRHNCTECDRSFISQKILQKHKTSSHSDDGTYVCDICGMCFNKHSFAWNKHQRSHRENKPFACNECDKRFSSNFNLIVHKRVHTGERPFQCDVCNKFFKQRSAMLTHKQTHTGERPYICNVCGKTFPLHSKLKIHERVHTGNLPFKCDICNKEFNYSGNLASHKLTHTGERPYQCPICGKRFTRTDLLNRHQKTHSGEQPYKCEICDKHFSRKDNLQEHVGIHTGKRPFKCQLCNKSFAARSYLSNHVKMHTGERKISRPYHHIVNTETDNPQII